MCALLCSCFCRLLMKFQWAGTARIVRKHLRTSYPAPQYTDTYSWEWEFISYRWNSKNHGWPLPEWFFELYIIYKEVGNGKTTKNRRSSYQLIPAGPSYEYAAFKSLTIHFLPHLTLLPQSVWMQTVWNFATISKIQVIQNKFICVLGKGVKAKYGFCYKSVCGCVCTL